MAIILPELGTYALILALGLALMQVGYPIFGFWRRNALLLNSAASFAYAQAGCILFAYGCLTYGFLSNDFSIHYVASNSYSLLPWYYKISALWGAHEGSMLLWVSLLAVWTIMLAACSNSLPDELRSLLLAILGMISVGFLWFILATSNPFVRLLPQVPTEGVDLNPLLQDPGLAIHPPMLYMGYVGFAIAFAFAVASLWYGQFDKQWARWMRPWVLLAWGFLTFGITLGSWWAYRVLGWGGWWFWDPVENAALMPWLAGTALLHSLISVEKRDSFKAWCLLLAIIVFSLSLLGTFLVRSGVLTSVHAFATDPGRGAFMLVFLCVVIGGSLTLFALRSHTISSFSQFNLISKETFLLINNIVLLTLMVSVLLGTLYPLMLDALAIEKISVGPPYFNFIFLPFSILLFIAMGLGPLTQWQGMSGQALAKLSLKPAIFGILATMICALTIKTHFSGLVILELLTVWWVIAVAGMNLVGPQNLRRLPMVLAHVGVGVCLLGIIFNSGLKAEREVLMRVGETLNLQNYQLTLTAIQPIRASNYSGVAGVFDLKENNHFVSKLFAEKRKFKANDREITVAAIDASLNRDIYVALGEALPGDAWGVRVYYKPFVRWIWLGGLLMMAGGLLSAAQLTGRVKK